MEDTNKVATPECDKALAVRAQSQIIGEFLEWLQETKECRISTEQLLGCGECAACDEGRIDDCMDSEYKHLPIRQSTEQLLAEFFKIDLKKMEEEKQALLAAIRE